MTDIPDKMKLVTHPDGTKFCSLCGTKKPVSEFGKNKNNWGGIAVYCKPCTKVRQAKYRDMRLKKKAGF